MTQKRHVHEASTLLNFLEWTQGRTLERIQFGWKDQRGDEFNVRNQDLVNAVVEAASIYAKARLEQIGVEL